ncbi:bacterial low temperature requirement A protein-domain-containing protein [Morchella snyderi]|nr:bacterial low temperature requirement A protein-domain-containing protein [Morchella snyderi]
MLPPLSKEGIIHMRESQLLSWIADPFTKYEHPHGHHAEGANYELTPKYPGDAHAVEAAMETLEEHIEVEEATPIELFYDLFFVANLTTVTSVQYITEWRNLSSYILFFIILWFTWLHVTLLDVRFSVDSVYERICKAMHFAVMAAFSSVSTDWDPFSPDDVYSVRSLRTMTLTLMFSRIVLGIQYVVIMVYGRSRKKAVVPTAIHAVVMFISAGVYLGMFWGFQEGTKKKSYLGWYAMAIFEIGAVIITSSVWKSVSFKKTHLVERMGLLTLIILGEGIIVMLKAINAVVKGFGWTKSTFGVVAASLCIIYLFWMFYFDYTPRDIHYGTIRQQIWAMLHFPFHLSLVLVVEGLRQLTTMQSFNLLATDIGATVVLLEPLTPSGLAEYFRDIFLIIYEDGTSKSVLKGYSKILSTIDAMEATPTPSVEYESYLHTILFDAYTGLGEYYGIKAPKEADSTQQLIAMLRVFDLVFQYFFIALGVVFLLYGVFAIIVRRHMDVFDYVSIGLRFLASLTFFSMLGLYFNPIKRDSYINFMWGGPWPVPTVCFIMIFVLVVDKAMAYFALKRIRSRTRA